MHQPLCCRILPTKKNKDRKHILLLIIYIAICAATLSAATAKIHKVWLEHNVTINNKKAMKVHCEFEVEGMNGKTGSMLISAGAPLHRIPNVIPGSLPFRVGQG